jgi:hypothetical protein
MTSPTTSINISVIILCHRFNQRLVDAITSAQFADQVLLIEVGAKVDTSPIKGQLKFEQFTYQSQTTGSINFAKVRNQALTLAKHDWIFFLDSDEVVTSDSVPSIADLVSKNQFTSAFVRRKDIFLGKELKWGEVGSNWIIRIGHKKTLKFIRPIHEVAKKSTLTTYASITLIHNSHSSVSSFLSKVAAYSQQEAKFRYQNKIRFSLFESLFYPAGKFFANYLFKLGFLDGWRGLIYAVMMTVHSLAVRVYLFELGHKPQHEKN